MAPISRLWSATEAWRHLNGVFCVYKPAGMEMLVVRGTLIGNLCRDLNSLELGRRQERLVQIVDDPQSPDGIRVINGKNLADHPLAIGPRFQQNDIRLGWAKDLGYNTSGVCLMGVNDGNGKLTELRKSRFISTYHIHCKLGFATDTYHESGRVLAKSSYGHVHSSMIDRVLASVQATHQREMYAHMGVHMQSQEAYEIACKGPVRPSDKSDPLIYGIRLLDLKPPEFIFEVQSINETEVYLMKLVHDLGLLLKSMAVCTRLRQVRTGYFDLKLALLRKHWTLENIISNISHCRDFSRWNKLKPSSANLIQLNLPEQVTI